MNASESRLFLFSSMKKLLLLLFFPALLLSNGTEAQGFPVYKDDIVIVYENDVHGAINGYPVIAAVRDSLRRLSPNTILVSCGDFLSGTSLGSHSQGGYIVRMMNAVAYDYYTLGNHEFDYGVPMLQQRVSQLKGTPLCCNFTEVATGTCLFKPSHIDTLGGTSVAFIGITTPAAATTSTPTFFQDSLKRWLYTFHADHLDSLLQSCVDEVRGQGADYVVLISHIGEVDMPAIVTKTAGIDVVLDGHSHSVLPHSLLSNRDGQPVLWTSAGSKFRHIGQVVISPSRGAIFSDLLQTDELGISSPRVADTLEVIKNEYASVGSRIVGRAEAEVRRDYSQKDFLDSPLGNLCTDAFRVLSGAQVGLMNRGGIRADLPSGDIAFDDLYSSFPFDNKVMVVEMSGQCLLDALEMGLHSWPRLLGATLQVSGITFEVNPDLPNPVVLDENGIFQRVEGRRRVSNVKVWNDVSKRYEPLRPKKRYTVCGCDYFLLNHGDGHNFYDVKVIGPVLGESVKVMEAFVHKHLQGTIGSRYFQSQGRIRVRY